MNNVFGNNINISLYGESHGEEIGVLISGLKSGIKFDLDLKKSELSRRATGGNLNSKRKESDNFEIRSGYFNGFTTGSPILIAIKNEDAKSNDYAKEIIRPSHADFTNYVKSNGFNDYRGGGSSSARF